MNSCGVEETHLLADCVKNLFVSWKCYRRRKKAAFAYIFFLEEILQENTNN